jgi:hypothetical protein
MSGEHAKREIMTGDKPEARGEHSQGSPATNIRRNPLPPTRRIGKEIRRRR